MRIHFRSSVLLIFRTASARTVALCFLLLVRASLLSLFVFFSYLRPSLSLEGFHFGFGYFLMFLGALLAAPLVLLSRMVPAFAPVLSTASPWSYGIAAPTALYLAVAVPFYTALLLGCRPACSLISRGLTVLQRRLLSVFSSQWAAAMYSGIRALLVYLVVALFVHFYFIHRFWLPDSGGDNYLRYASGFAAPFRLIALLPSLPVWLLSAHAGPLTYSDLTPSTGLLAANAALVGAVGAVVSAVRARLVRKTNQSPS